MPPSAGNVIGASLFLLFGKMELQNRWMKMSCLWNYRMLKLISRDLKVKARWQTSKNGSKKTLRPTRCPVMQAAAGIFCVTWTHITTQNSATGPYLTTGGRLIFILGGLNTRWATY